MSEAETLETKRAELTTKLENLRVSPDVADLLKRADDAVRGFKSEVAGLEGQIEDLDRGIGARERHRRAEAAQDRQHRWAAQREQIVTEEESRLRAFADAEAATRALVKAVDDIIATNARMATLARQLSPDRKVPMALNSMDLVHRIAGRLAAVLGTIKGHRNRLGGIDWPGGASGLYPAEQSWVEDEEKRMAAALLQPLLEKGKA